ncbi:MAG: hypothetical protein ACSNEK_06090, partial [Parachlamydiaceae bacterium]
LVYLARQRALIIWPHLDAAGRLGRQGPEGKFKYGDGLDGNRKNIFKPGTLTDAKRVNKGGKPLIWQQIKGGERFNHKAGRPMGHL